MPLYQKFAGIGTAGKDSRREPRESIIKSIVLDIDIRSGRLSVSLAGRQKWIAGREEERATGPRSHGAAKLDVSPSDLPFVLPKKACNTVGAPCVLRRPEDYTWTVSQPEQVEKKLRWTPGGDRKRACRRQSERVSSHSRTLPDGK